MSKLQHNFRILFATQFFFFWMYAGSDLKSQSHYMLDQLGGFSSSGKVYIQWTLRKGTSCYGIGIYRSVNGTDFDRIGEIAGECGSSETPQTYNFTDENPVPGRLNSYVLELGIWGRTEPALEVFAATGAETAFRVIPNPISEKGRIYFPNPDNLLHHLHVFDLSGRKIAEIQSSDQFFEMTGYELDVARADHRQATLFYYTISDERRGMVIAGTFLVH